MFLHIQRCLRRQLKLFTAEYFSKLATKKLKTVKHSDQPEAKRMSVSAGAAQIMLQFYRRIFFKTFRDPDFLPQDIFQNLQLKFKTCKHLKINLRQNGCLRQLEPLKLCFNFTAEFHNSKHASAHSNINDFLICIINYVTPNMADLGS